MRFGKFLLGTAVGATVGFAVGAEFQKDWITPEKALKIAKEKFKAKGPISGSWIYMKPQTLSKEYIDYKVYYGGITRVINGKSVPYEFYVEVKTGTLLDVAKIEGTAK